MAKVYDTDKTWFEDFRDQFKSLDGHPLKKIEHFFTYYWRMTVGIIVGIIIIAALITGIVYNSIPQIISGVFYPSTISQDSADTLKSELAEILGVNPSKYHIDVTSLAVDEESTEQNYAAAQVIISRIMSRDLDFFGSTEEMFSGLMSADDEDDCILYNLKEILTEENLNRLKEEGRVLYYDTSFTDEYPYLINIQDTKLADMLELTGTENYIGFIASSKRLDSINALMELIR